MLSYNVASWLKVNYFCGTLQRRESCCTLIRFWGQGMVTYNYVCMRVFVQHVGARTASSPPHQSADPSVPFMLQLGLLLLQPKVTSSECISTCIQCQKRLNHKEKNGPPGLPSALYDHFYHNLVVFIQIFPADSKI